MATAGAEAGGAATAGAAGDEPLAREGEERCT